MIITSQGQISMCALAGCEIIYRVVQGHVMGSTLVLGKFTARIKKIETAYRDSDTSMA